MTKASQSHGAWALRAGLLGLNCTAARFANAAGDDEQALRLSLSALATAKRGGDTRAILEAAVLLQLWIPGSAGGERCAAAAS